MRSPVVHCHAFTFSSANSASPRGPLTRGAFSDTSLIYEGVWKVHKWNLSTPDGAAAGGLWGRAVGSLWRVNRRSCCCVCLAPRTCRRRQEARCLWRSNKEGSRVKLQNGSTSGGGVVLPTALLCCARLLICSVIFAKLNLCVYRRRAEPAVPQRVFTQQKELKSEHHNQRDYGKWFSVYVLHARAYPCLQGNYYISFISAQPNQVKLVKDQIILFWSMYYLFIIGKLGPQRL